MIEGTTIIIRIKTGETVHKNSTKWLSFIEKLKSLTKLKETMTLKTEIIIETKNKKIWSWIKTTFSRRDEEGEVK